MTASFRKSITQTLVISTCFFNMITLHTATAANNYIKPNQTKELFKLEKIPLQVDSMKELSKHLVSLSQRPQDDSGAQLRATAQMLILAMHLDPANQNARGINRAFSEGNRPDSAPEESILKAKSRLRFYRRWLANAEAGQHANQLAKLLTDATKTLQDDTLNNADIANWMDVIPPLEKYPKSAVSPQDGQMANHVDESSQENLTPAPPNKPISPPITSKFHLMKMSLHAPLELINYEKFKNSKNQIQTRTTITHAVPSISLALTPCKPNEKTQLKIKCATKGKVYDQDSFLLQAVRDTLHALLTKRHGGLAQVKGDVLISGGFYTNANGLALTAPLALMLESSINNTPLREDIHICAKLDNTGKLSLPKNFWHIIRSLHETKTGGRLIVPSSAYEILTQALVYGHPDLFTRWEILSADTLDEALAAATKQSASDLSRAHEYFKTVQSIAEKNAVTTLAVNHSVRSRLTEILKLAPNHVSARILLLQGSGKRPMRLSEEALAHELLPVIRKLDSTLQRGGLGDNLSATTFKKIHAESRSSIDKLESFVDRSHDDLYQATLFQANQCRRLMVMIRRTVKPDDITSGAKAKKLFLDMQRDVKVLLHKALETSQAPRS